MPIRASRLAVLAFATAALVGQTGCQRAAEEPAAADAAAQAVFELDETRLMQPVRFVASDLDPEGDACRDLSQYVNGKWLAANPIPGDETSWGASDVLRQRSLDVRREIAEHAASLPNAEGIQKIVADLWTSGMDEARINAQGLTPLADRLAAIEALTDGPSVAAYLRKVAATDENPLFAFGPEADFKNSSMNMAYVFQGGLGLPDKTYYFDADKKPLREAYERHIAKVLELSGWPSEQAVPRAKSVLAFETRLARVSKSTEEMSRDVSLYYEPMALDAADRLTPNFPWTAFFESQGLAEPELFSLSVPQFHKEVSKMLADVPVDQWQSYMRFHLVDGASPYLADAFATEHFEFYDKTLQGQKEQQPRWKRVLRMIDGSAGEAMGQLYVDVAFPPSSKARMEELVGNLRAALETRIKKLTWMSDETKQKALAKLATFTPKVGFPDKWRDWSGLATQRDSYLDNVFAARAFNYRFELDKIGKPVDETEWGMTPQTVNAYYHPLHNEIVFPAAILQPPYFDPKADDALNYGAIGAVIGHELTHGYDDQGSRFGATGNFEQWWTEADAARFKALTGKLVRQYDRYEAAPGLKVNGNMTLGENIADLGGLNIAYDALQIAVAGQPDPKIDGLTRDQRFFIGWAAAWRDQYTPELMKVLVAADPHSPPALRANGTPTNMPAFAAAFGCKPGDPLVNAGDALVSIW
jgi:putative endopeptidase